MATPSTAKSTTHGVATPGAAHGAYDVSKMVNPNIFAEDSSASNGNKRKRLNGSATAGANTSSAHQAALGVNRCDSGDGPYHIVDVVWDRLTHLYYSSLIWTHAI